MNSSQLAVPELATVKVHGTTRQTFLLRATLAAGATYGATMVTPFVTRALAQEGGDVAILNYALTLEYLEAAFYETGIKEVSGLSSDEMRLAKEIRDNENEHVDALKATVEKLGGKPVAQPTFDFGAAFDSRSAFLKTANTLEDTGVSAYNGAAPAIESTEVLAAAGGIVQIEARHAALIRLVRGRAPAPVAFDKASEMKEILDAVTPFIKS